MVAFMGGVVGKKITTTTSPAPWAQHAELGHFGIHGVTAASFLTLTACFDEESLDRARDRPDLSGVR
jgi:hypothetical protein